MTNSPFQSDEDLLGGLPQTERDPIRTAMHLKELLNIPEVKQALHDVRLYWYTKFKASTSDTQRLEAQAGAIALDTLEQIFRSIHDAGEREIQERTAKKASPASLDL